MKSLALFIPLLLSGSGCHIFFGDDDPPCLGDREAAYPAQGTRNPVTGRCEYTGGGGGCGDDPAPLAEPGAGVSAEDAIFLDWALCDSVCEGVTDEATCAASDGCRAAYRDLCPPDADCLPNLEFVECWGTAPSGPIRGGGCTGLDAYSCSLHDDCSPVHFTAGDTYGDFYYCVDEEAPCFSDAPAGDTWLRNPSTGGCEGYGVDPCSGGGAPVPLPDWGVCYGPCEALDEGTCAASDACRAIYVDACPECDALVLEYAACWPTAPSGPVRGGDCTALDAQECSRHDDCSAVHQNAWGLCDPSSPCPWTPEAFAWCQAEGGIVTPPPTCEEIVDEVACVGNAACQPVYLGSDCSCDDSGCTCLTWTFQSCQTGE